ncbi:MAG: hypothetical protein Q4A06_07995 [Cardiobacteriaceae bacterium]|nr:hypothetical protein [Cardiobacteriaceae bacterium]
MKHSLPRSLTIIFFFTVAYGINYLFDFNGIIAFLVIAAGVFTGHLFAKYVLKLPRGGTEARLKE